jgi:outer membrane protein OmpA-like peptidoglycan-associated protein
MSGAATWVRRLLPLLLATGCASSHVTLLNGEGDNPVGGVAVIDPKTGDDVRLIETAGTRASVNGATARLSPGDPAAVERRYAALLDALPRPPRRFILMFPEGSTTLTAESLPDRQLLIDEIRTRGAGVDVQIEGHSDRVGSDEDNDRLSTERARAARDMLAAEGLIPADSRFVGRGERSPRPGHATADGVADPANRRVEIVVR